MYKKIETSKELFRLSFIFTVLFYVVAHGHRFSNTFFSGDSLRMIYQNDAGWEVALGRFMHPVFVLLRGAVESPFLISVISVSFYALSVYLVVDFLEIRRRLSVCAVAALMTCNPTVLATNATFLPYADFYVISLFLAVFGTWLMKRGEWSGFVSGAIALSISMGTYQAYICVAVAMVMIHFVFRLIENVSLKKTWISLGKYVASFACAAVLYYGIWKLFQTVFGIWTADTSNGLASLGDFVLADLLGLVGTTYAKFVSYFVNPEVFLTLPFRGESMSIIWVYLIRFCNLAVVILLVTALIIRNIRCKTTLLQRVLQVCVLAFFPFGANVVCFISQGMEHTLMIYSFAFLYVFAIKATEEMLQVPETSSKVTLRLCGNPWVVTYALLAVITWSNMVYSNQVYVKKDLQDKAAHSLMTRIVYEIEKMPGYVAGETPVLFYGRFTDTEYIQDIEAFKTLTPYGMAATSMQYPGTEHAYLRYVLNVNMNLIETDSPAEAIAQMPLYPAAGSIAYVDGTIVVKISE